jgi:hypothetical protein
MTDPQMQDASSIVSNGNKVASGSKKSKSHKEKAPSIVIIPYDIRGIQMAYVHPECQIILKKANNKGSRICSILYQ